MRSFSLPACLLSALCASTVALGVEEVLQIPDPGQLNIVSQPGVEVMWDGHPVGKTDAAGLLVIRRIPPGFYELVLRKAGHQEQTAQVEVSSGGQSVRIELPSIGGSRLPSPPTRSSAKRREPAAEPVAPAVIPDPPAKREPWTPPEERESEPRSESAAPAESSLEPDDSRKEPARVVAADLAPSSREEAASLPPILYLLALSLVTIGGALALQIRRRARAREAFFTEPPLLVESTPRAVEAPEASDGETTSLLEDIQRREVEMLESMSVEEPIDVDVVDLGPAEEED